jgi:hypothetical protein
MNEKSQPYQRMINHLLPMTKIPAHFFLGLVLVAIFWTASWARFGILGEYSFFLLWVGYILVVDALVAMRRGSSLLTRAPGEFAALFVLSAPVWWIFEFLNNIVLNWHYLVSKDYSAAQIIVEATINFGTVIPAVFETAELVGTFGWLEKFRTGWRMPVGRIGLWIVMYSGVAALAVLIVAPHYAFGLIWLWLFLLVDPLNALRGRASLIAQAALGEWRQWVALALGVLVCGFFWEMWNFFAMPKWYYTVPILGFGKVFEMPILGYLGYIPFAWELYALYHFVWGVMKRPVRVFEPLFD